MFENSDYTNLTPREKSAVLREELEKSRNNTMNTSLNMKNYTFQSQEQKSETQENKETPKASYEPRPVGKSTMNTNFCFNSFVKEQTISHNNANFSG